MIRRKRRKHRHFMRLAWFALPLLLLGAVIVYCAISAPGGVTQPEGPAATDATALTIALTPGLTPVRPAGARRAMRPVYPYSVIRGGVYSVAEFSAALHKDSVASDHYAGFHVASLRMTSAPEPMPLYASYRIGDSVYWSSHRVHIAAGEALITDGTNLARVRCGNRLSDSPQEPVTRMEPMEREMDTPEPFDPAEPPAADSGVLDLPSVHHTSPAPGSALAFEIFPAVPLPGAAVYPGTFGSAPAQAAGGLSQPSQTMPGASSGLTGTFITRGGESAPPGDSDRLFAMARFPSNTLSGTAPAVPETTPPVFPGVITDTEGFPEDSSRNGGGTTASDPGTDPGPPITTTGLSTPTVGGSPPDWGVPPGGEPHTGGHEVPEPVAGALVCVGIVFLCISARRLRHVSH
jgi:hypothetical protein